jgi:5'-nucleotidase
MDMDGTILDLHFDTRFWLHHVPTVFGARLGLDRDRAWALLEGKLRRMEGTLQWYCLDYWSKELELDLVLLKNDLVHLIRYRSGAREFLVRVRASARRVILVTNAHSQSLALKLHHTDLGDLVDGTVTSHDFGHPKESAPFWQALAMQHPFDPAHTLFVDDSLPVLRAAKQFDIAHLLAVAKPDSQLPTRDTCEFAALHHFDDIKPNT